MFLFEYFSTIITIIRHLASLNEDCVNFYISLYLSAFTYKYKDMYIFVSENFTATGQKMSHLGYRLYIPKGK